MLYALCSMLYAINIILCKSFRKTSVGGEEAHDGVVLLIGWLKTTPNALTHLTRDFTIIPDPWFDKAISGNGNAFAYTWSYPLFMNEIVSGWSAPR